MFLSVKIKEPVKCLREISYWFRDIIGRFPKFWQIFPDPGVKFSVSILLSNSLLMIIVDRYETKELHISDTCCKEFNIHYFILYLFLVINHSIF